MASRKPLPPDHARFVDEYLIDHNATRAYHTAYPHASYGTCRAESSKLLAKPSIRQEIKNRQFDMRRRLRIGADKVLRECAAIAFSDFFDLLDDANRLRPLREIPLYARRAIMSMKVKKVKTTTRKNGDETVIETEQVVEYRLWSKTDALEKLFRYLGLTQEITPLDALLASLPVDMADAVRDAMGAAIDKKKPRIAAG